MGDGSVSYWADRYEYNEMYASEREESRSARHGLSDTMLASACRHDYRRSPGGGGVCLLCGDHIGADEL